MSAISLYYNLTKHIQAGCPGIYIQTSEEGRVDALLLKLKQELGFRRIQEWSLGYGWINFERKQPVADPNSNKTELEHCLLNLLDEDLENSLILIKGAKLALENNNLAIARLKQLLNRIECHHAGECSVILVSEAAFVPQHLESQLTLLTLPLPSRAEIASQLDAFIQNQGINLPKECHSQMLSILSGLGEREIRQAMNMVLSGQLEVSDQHLQQLLREKEQIIAKSGVLEMVKTDVELNDIGGLENLKKWLIQRAKILHALEQAAKQGVQAPKGVLIAGMPGCGKSLTAKVAAKLFQLPLLRLDIGSLLGKYVGESEHNMRRALSMAETVSPCVLWVDELEKAFVGMGGGNASEVTSRLLGYFLTWMQEKTSAVFVIATANDISALPPELLRKGRFDEIFYVGFPNSVERESILRIYLNKSSQTVTDLNMSELITLCRDYTGADIHNAINEALTNAFVDDMPLSQSLLTQAIQSTIPLRETLLDQINHYEELFEKLKLRSASEYQGLSVAQMRRMVDDPNQVKREEVANNPDCPEDLLEKLAEDKEPAVVEAVYKNPRCPEHLLSKRINLDKADQKYNEKILELACLHENVPLDLLSLKIEKKQLPPTIANCLSNTKSHKLQLMIAQEFSIEHKRKLASNPKLSPEAQRALLVEKDCKINNVLAANGSLVDEVIREFIEVRAIRKYFIKHRPDLLVQWRECIELAEKNDPATKNHLLAVELGFEVSNELMVADDGVFIIKGNPLFEVKCGGIFTYYGEKITKVELLDSVLNGSRRARFVVKLGDFVSKGDVIVFLGECKVTAPVSGYISALDLNIKSRKSKIGCINPA